MGKGNGEGEVRLQATWDQGGQGSHHIERRDSREGLGNKGSYQGELSRGLIKGLQRMLNIVNLYICIMLLWECG